MNGYRKSAVIGGCLIGTALGNIMGVNIGNYLVARDILASSPQNRISDEYGMSSVYGRASTVVHLWEQANPLFRAGFRIAWKLHGPEEPYPAPVSR